MDKNVVLITGGAGYIGSHAVLAFQEAGRFQLLGKGPQLALGGGAQAAEHALLQLVSDRTGEKVAARPLGRMRAPPSDRPAYAMGQPQTCQTLTLELDH